jgi:nucleoid DNA-binding protein
MFHILYKYLILSKQLSIPGIGHFYVEQAPARLDSTGKVIHSPLPAIKFTNTVTTADRNFFEFASQELAIEQWDTIRQFHDFSYKLKNDVNTHTRIELPGIGSLSRNKLGGLSFEPEIVLEEYFPGIGFDNFLEEEKVEEIPEPFKATAAETEPEVYIEEEVPVKKERWWIAAMVLGVVAVAAIVYYYYSNPSR